MIWKKIFNRKCIYRKVNQASSHPQTYVLRRWRIYEYFTRTSNTARISNTASCTFFPIRVSFKMWISVSVLAFHILLVYVLLYPVDDFKITGMVKWLLSGFCLYMWMPSGCYVFTQVRILKYSHTHTLTYSSFICFSIIGCSTKPINGVFLRWVFAVLNSNVLLCIHKCMCVWNSIF